MRGREGEGRERGREREGGREGEGRERGREREGGRRRENVTVIQSLMRGISAVHVYQLHVHRVHVHDICTYTVYVNVYAFIKS